MAERFFFVIETDRTEVQTFKAGDHSKACPLHCFLEGRLKSLKQEPSSPALA